MTEDNKTWPCTIEFAQEMHGAHHCAVRIGIQMALGWAMREKNVGVWRNGIIPDVALGWMLKCLGAKLRCAGGAIDGEGTTVGEV